MHALMCLLCLLVSYVFAHMLVCISCVHIHVCFSCVKTISPLVRVSLPQQTSLLTRSGLHWQHPSQQQLGQRRQFHSLQMQEVKTLI